MNNNDKLNSKNSLENIIKNIINFPTKTAEIVIYNTPISSILGALGGFIYGSFSLDMHKITYDNYKYIIPGAFIGYLASTVWKKWERNIYPSNLEINQKTKLKDITKLTSDFLIENPLTTALTINLPLTELALQNQSLYEKTIFYSVMSFITESSLKILRTEKRIKKSVNLKEKQNIKLNKISRYLDSILEHPGIVALTIGIARASQVYYGTNFSNQVQRYSHNPEPEILFKPLYGGIGFGLMAGLGCILLGGVLHSESIKNIRTNLKITRKKFAGDSESELKMREELNLNEGPIKTKNLVKIGNLYLGKGEKEKSLIAYKKAIKSLLRETYYNNYELLISNFSTDIPFRIKRILNTGDYNPLETAIISLANGNLELSKKILLEKKSKIESKEELINIDYMLFLAARYSNNQELVNKTAAEFMNNLPENIFSEIGNGKSKVITPIGNFLDHEIVIKLGDYRSLQKEFYMTRTIAHSIALLRDQRFSTIYPLSVLQYEPPQNPEITGLYLMDYEMGKTFAEKLIKDQVGARKNLNDVADFLAYIHSSIPLDLIEETRNHGEEISKRLSNLKKPNIPKNLQEKIRLSLGIFLEPLKDSEIVYDKDAHSDNWMITKEDNIIVLDCENRVKNNRERDIANLTDTWNFFTEDEKQAILERVNKNYSVYTGIKIDAKKSRYVYLNSVVIKALEDIPPLREREDFVRMNAVIKNAYSAISNLKKEFPDEYYKNLDKINSMQSSLKELEIHLKNNTI